MPDWAKMTTLLLAAQAMLGFAPATPELRSGLKARTPILTYHDVVPKRDGNSLWFDCSVPELNGQLDWLTTRGAKFVSVDALYDHLTRGTALPKGAVVITFADNYLGFYTNAWPILRRRKIPVAMFVHTGFVGGRQGRPKMDWTQLRELDRSGLVTVASQTVSHPEDLSKLTAGALRRELVDSKAELERQLGHSILYLAYPNGKYDLRVANAAAQAGYRMAFTEVTQPAELSPSIFRVNRYVHTRYRQAWQAAR